MRTKIIVKFMSAAIAFVTVFGAKADEARANGYTWSYGLNYCDGEYEAQIYGISPEPVGHVTIPSTLDGCPVTEIGGWTFQGCERMTGVTIPSTVVSIGYNAFANCSGLKELTIPGSVKFLGNYAFEACSNLEKVTIEEGVVQVGDVDNGPFSECSSLREVHFPSTVESISHPFIDCENLKIVTFASGSRFVSENNVICTKNWDEIVCVWGAPSTKWTNFEIPMTVKKIGDFAFFYCEKLKAIHLPLSVEEIGMNPFIRCYSLESITIDSENKFYKIENDLLLTKDGKKVIATAGSYKEKRRDIVVPEGVEEVGVLALTSDMVDIRNVWLPTTLKTMNDALEWGGNGGKNGEYGAMNNVVFLTQDAFAVADGACFFCDCDIDNVWFAGPVPENFYSEEWWECGNVRKIHYTPEYRYEWESALQRIGYGSRGVVNTLDEFPKPPDIGSGGGEATIVIPSAASVYDGYLWSGDNVLGTIQAKVAKPKLNRKTNRTEAKVTVSIQLVGEKKITVKGEMDTATGIFTGETKDGRGLSLTFGMNGVSGTFDGFEVVGNRNLFSSKDKEEKAEAEAILEPWLGAMNMVLGGESRRDGVIAPYRGVFTVTVAKKGKVTVKGTLDGAKVSAKATALIGEDAICIPVAYSKKGVNLAFTLWLPLEGGDIEVVGIDGAVVGAAGMLKAGATFAVDGDLVMAIPGAQLFATDEAGISYNLFPDGESVSANGKKWLVADGVKAAKVKYDKKAGKITVSPGKKGQAIANTSGLKLTYKAKDGSFKGSFYVYTLIDGKFKKQKATVAGVLIDGVGYGTATIKKLGNWPVMIE